MDRRFEAAWQKMADRRDRGERFDRVIDSAPDDQLVAALAAVGPDREPVAANAIGTALLNRLHRKPFLGAFVVSLTTFVLIYVLDYAYTGTFLLLDAGMRANLLAAFSFVTAIVSLASWQMWRGHGRLARLRHAFRPRREY